MVVVMMQVSTTLLRCDRSDSWAVLQADLLCFLLPCSLGTFIDLLFSSLSLTGPVPSVPKLSSRSVTMIFRYSLSNPLLQYEWYDSSESLITWRHTVVSARSSRQVSCLVYWTFKPPFLSFSRTSVVSNLNRPTIVSRCQPHKAQTSECKIVLATNLIVGSQRQFVGERKERKCELMIQILKICCNRSFSDLLYYKIEVGWNGNVTRK